MLQSMGLQRVRHDGVIEQQQVLLHGNVVGASYKPPVLVGRQEENR